MFCPRGLAIPEGDALIAFADDRSVPGEPSTRPEFRPVGGVFHDVETVFIRPSFRKRIGATGRAGNEYVPAFDAIAHYAGE
jgi:hypothetical protein